MDSSPRPISQVFFRPNRQPLDALFLPQAVAVIGATEREGSVGLALMRNLRSFPGRVYPIHPSRPAVLGREAFPSIATAPGPVDLAIIATPAPSVPGIVRECAAAGVRAAIIISAGFKESGEAGAALEKQVMAEAALGRIRIVGPNCLGVMSPHVGLNASFAATDALPGNVAFISQSGALCTAILDWSLRQKVGFSAFVSVGSMLDVGWGDLIDWLGDHPQTQSIVMYMESVGEARSFLSAAREVALTKPIIVIKVGHTEAAARAAASHTGALTGSDAVLDAAFHRAGVLRVATLGELFDMAEVLAKQPRPQGPNLVMVTNAGGPGALATDMLVSSGGKPSALSPETLAALNRELPAHWSHANPIDVLGDADALRYAAAVQTAERDPGSNGSLVILTPQAMTQAAETASALLPLANQAKRAGKPFLTSWMGGGEVEKGRQILNEAGIPTYEYPDTAARAFALMWRHTENLRALYETPALAGDAMEYGAVRAKAAAIVHAARESGCVLLDKPACNAILSAYSIPIAETCPAMSEDEAEAAARGMGHPVVLKLRSETITHKTDVGGVKLDLTDDDSVRRAWRDIKSAVGATDFNGVTVEPMITVKDGYELILGSTIDPQFGPVLLFGSGGVMVDLLGDHALGLPPLTATLARRLMERTRIFGAFKGIRGRKPIDVAALEELLVRFSRLVAEQPGIKEIDINPLLVSPGGFHALDVRIVLQPRSVTDDALPGTAIRPYPLQYITQWQTANGAPVTIRPIRPEDETLLHSFHRQLSEQSVYSRYFSHLKLDQRIAHQRLSRICFIDYDREMALVVEHIAKDGAREIAAVGRLSKLHGLSEAEFAILVSDPWQGKGLGAELLRRLVMIGRDEKLTKISADILPDNHAMQAVARKAGFTIHFDMASSDCRAELNLEG